MHAHRLNRAFVRVHVAFVASLLVVLTLVAGPVPSTLAQYTPSPLLATQFFTAIGGDSSLIVLSPNALLHTPEGDFSGQAGLAQFGDELAGSFANLTFTTESVAQAGDLTIIAFTISGIHIDDYHGASSDCAQIAVPAVAVLRVSEEHTIDETRFREPTMIAIDTVTEQWIGYESDAIVNQIAAFNTLDPTLARDCGV